jgi:hypothetical protein
MLGVRLGGFRGMVRGVMKMPLGGVRVVRGRLVVSGFVVLCGFFMVTRRVLVVLGGLLMVLCCLLGHKSSLRLNSRVLREECSLGGYSQVRTA